MGQAKKNEAIGRFYPHGKEGWLSFFVLEKCRTEDRFILFFDLKSFFQDIKVKNMHTPNLINIYSYVINDISH